MTKYHKLTILISSLSLSCAAFAATDITTMPITASVDAACSVSSTGADFGPVVAFGGASTSGNIDINCSSGTSYQVALDAGLQPQDGNTVRAMQSGGGALIRYSIFKVSGGGGAEWGDSGFANTFTSGTIFPGVGDGTTQILGMNLEVVSEGANTYTAGASYSDTVTITVNF